MTAQRKIKGRGRGSTKAGVPELIVAPPQEKEPPRPPGFPVVGIGASAGGLDAFKRFFDAMPGNSGMGFVLIQHLAPLHESLTAELLGKNMSMTVVQAQHGMPVKANHVYVIPPSKDLNIRAGVLYLSEMAERRGVRIPIDFFFRSLAEDQQEKAVAVILSGTGSDGTLGLKDIKGYGGVTLVQSPETAQFDGMPRSAVNAGIADYVLPVEQIPEVLMALMRTRPPSAQIADYLPAILALVQVTTKYDFRYYKSGTLTRRIERRMNLNHLADVSAYLEFLRENPRETSLLLKDLLISVTGFFREPAAFEALEKEVIAALVRDKAADASIRVWVPGCATGEEPYSIAMVLLEQLAAAQKHCNLQIFASDIDREALARARGGVYPENVAADVSPERLQQFFKKEGDAYAVSKPVRDAVVFAFQNLINDPPFSRVDIVSCRNLLIYLEPALQRKVLSLFHYVLNDGGHLFLGNAETVGQSDDLFIPVSKKWRIYRRVGTARRNRLELPIASSLARTARPADAARGRSAEAEILGKIAHQQLLEQYAPFSVLINPTFEILYLHGAPRGYLEIRAGSPTQNLLSMARDALRAAIRTAVYQTLKLGQPAMARARLRTGKKSRLVKVTARPAVAPKGIEGLLLVSFEDERELPATAPDAEAGSARVDDDLVQALETELKSTKTDLTSTVQDMETAYEELKTSNEEILSMNEELQSGNEELETSKEELQSVNEELTTLNNQLQNKVDELAASNDDLDNLLASTDIATVFVDRQFRIKRFSTPARKLFNLIHSDLGRPLSDISHRIQDSTLLKDAQQVLERLAPVKKEVRTVDGLWYFQHAAPYQTHDNKIEGVVITFTDVTPSKEAEQTVREVNEWLQLLLTSANEAIYGVDVEGRGTFANRAFLVLTGYTTEEVIGKNVHALIHHTRADGSHFPWSESFVLRSINEGSGAPENRCICWRKDGTNFPASFSSNAIVQNSRITGAVAVFRDITKAESVARKLDYQASHDALTDLLNRNAFEQRLDRVIEASRLGTEQHVLCYLDLNQFKAINDACGHEAGDDALKKVAEMLRHAVRKRDTVARMGGDEFGLLLERCDLAEAREVVKKVSDAIAGFEFQWAETTFKLGISVGMVLVTAATTSRMDLLRDADAACYEDKKNGNGVK